MSLLNINPTLNLIHLTQLKIHLGFYDEKDILHLYKADLNAE